MLQRKLASESSGSASGEQLGVVLLEDPLEVAAVTGV
jgi:hypothetical protein